MVENKKVKVKLKSKVKSGSRNPNEEYDDDVIPPVEEHFILRLPNVPDVAKLREKVRAREVPEDLKIQFKGDIIDILFILFIAFIQYYWKLEKSYNS